jgi:hypothetical protein
MQTGWTVAAALVHDGGERMNTNVQMWCIWCGPLALITYAIAFWGIAGFMPPSSPMTSAADLAAFYQSNALSIRIGLLLTLVFSTLFFPWFAVISVHIARIEGRLPVLALMQFGGGTLLMVYFYLCSLIWIAAAYRPDIDPSILRFLHESSWLMFVMVFPEYVLQQICIAVAGFMDKSSDRMFPRWFCYFCLWNGVVAFGGGFSEFVYHGPFAWNGIIGFWLPVSMFAVWIGMLVVLMRGYLLRQEQAPGVAAVQAAA